jgi:hypothetical protein
MPFQSKFRALSAILTTSVTLVFVVPVFAADSVSGGGAGWSKPTWLTELSVGAKQSYDDNVLVVSGLGLPVQGAWVSQLSLKLGVDCTPAPNAGGPIKTLAFVYQPDVFRYARFSEESYTAHRFGTTLKGEASRFKFSFENAFLHNDGSKQAVTYALNQLSGAAANQLDRFRSFYTHSVPRERRTQDQDRATAQVQRDADHFFVRAAAALTYYNLDTHLFNTSVAPYKGYQDYPDRWDASAGLDVGFKTSEHFAFTLGQRSGYQHQDQFSAAVSSDRHYSSNHYQRALAGLEGQLTSWLTLKIAVGPDFRRYNPSAPVPDLYATRSYLEGSLSAVLPAHQTLTANYRQAVWMSATGVVPYIETVSSVNWHWAATKQWGFDLGARYLEADYTIGNDLAGSAPSLRDDVEYEGSGGVSYTLQPHWTVGLTCVIDKGFNALHGLAPAFAPDYRNFTHAVTTLSLQYKL